MSVGTGATSAVRLQAPRSQRRAARQAELRAARRDKRRWTILSSAILCGAFGLTVGILDVLH